MYLLEIAEITLILCNEGGGEEGRLRRTFGGSVGNFLKNVTELPKGKMPQGRGCLSGEGCFYDDIGKVES